MIIGDNRAAVIENIRRSAESGDFWAKVEPGDPVLTPDEEREITERYLVDRYGRSYKFKRGLARLITRIATRRINRDTEIVGEVDFDALRGGVIVTSNHFSPLENTAVRYFMLEHGIKRMSVVSQVSNFAMSGAIGFLMNYSDTIPISGNPRYMARDLPDVLSEKLSEGEAVLIYPEQEMWFNYRKPRPPKEGAYHFAAKLGYPIASLFVEMVDTREREKQDKSFLKVKYRVHFLGFIYPDPALTVRENRVRMCRRDYELKCEAYERIYGRTLKYDFERGDIAGWINGR